MSGCRSPHDSIESILDRQSQAMRKLPVEARARMIDTEVVVVTEPATDLLEPGLLSLLDARGIALRANPDIHAARARLESALARIGEARSFYYPQVELSQTASRTFLSPTRQTSLGNYFGSFYIPDLPANPSVFDLINTVSRLSSYLPRNYSTGTQSSFSSHATVLAASWTIFDGFAREARLMSVKETYQATVMSLADVERLIVQAVDAAYFQAQLGQEELRVALADEAFSEKQLSGVRKRYEAAKISKADVLNFEVRVRAARANVLSARRLRDTGRIMLAELLGLPEAHLPEEVTIPALEAEESIDLDEQQVEDWLQRAYHARPDLAQVRHEVAARHENIVLARGQFYPELNLRGSWGFETLHNLNYSQDDQSSAMQLEFRWPLFSGGFRTSQLRRANAEWWEASSRLRKKHLEIGKQVRRALVDLHDAQAQVLIQRENRAAAGENRDIVETQYSAGKSSLVRLNEAQRDYVQADGALARARVRLRQAWSDLHAAAGTYYKQEQGLGALPADSTPAQQVN